MAIGSRLGPYEILTPLGSGGMGEVYRARDSKLGRDIAVKVLPDAFARDADRMARFQREAKLLAALNHPNIAAIYGFEDSNGAHALVMELVEGPTLADRIKQGPIPIDEALRIAKQICEALEYAHERGIVHRDLKPANVKVTNDDAVKVLDFGLAKALDNDASSIDISSSPTMSRMATMQGVLLGTAAYMSPEQAKAKPVDRRADIWALGCVLYEMLTGKMAFSGETVTDTLAAVVMKDPDWSLLPPATPARLRILLQRCLQKDPKQRLRDIGEARIALDEVLSGAPEPSSSAVVAVPTSAPFWSRALPWALFGATAVALVAVLALAFIRTDSRQQQSIRSLIPPPPKVSFAFSPQPYGAPLLSPDGTWLVFPGQGTNGKESLWVRRLDWLDAQQLQGTDGAAFAFWAPDSRQIGFFQDGKLKKIDVTGGPAVTICDAENARGGTWNQSGTILFAPLPSLAVSATGATFLQVSAAGGTPSAIASREEKLSNGAFSNRWPMFLPDGRHFLYLSGNLYAQGTTQLGIYIGELGSKETKFLVQSDSDAFYAAPGYLLFIRADTLMAQRFDATHQELKGGAFPVGQNVGSPENYRLGLFSVSQTGLLIYGAAPELGGELVWFDAAGKRLGTAGPPGASFPRLSPDGKRLAYASVNATARNGDIWTEDLGRGVQTRLTFGPLNFAPVWSPDGSRIAYGSAAGPSLPLTVTVKDSSGAGNPESFSSSENKFQIPTDWSRDGRYILFQSGASGSTRLQEIWAMPLFGDHKPFPYLLSQFGAGEGVLSPDGRLVAYVSNESGNVEIYLSPFPGGGSKWQVSQGGGAGPQWSHDGGALYYVAPGGKIMEASVKANGSSVEIGAPRQLFQDELIVTNEPEADIGYSVTPDGKRFLVAEGSANTSPLTLVTNWSAAPNK
jgi:eukaryotic-like serine/threonine-protein kinase